MGNCCSVSVPLDQTVNKVSQCLDEQRGYIHNLDKNLKELEETIEELTAKRIDLSRKFKIEEDRGQQTPKEFQVWLDRVETNENRVKDLLRDKNVELERLCLCGVCSKSLISSYRYGKTVFSTLRIVEKLKSKDFGVVAAEAPTPAVVERQLQPIIVGQETMLDRAWNVEKFKSEVSDHVVADAPTPAVVKRQLQPIIVGQETILDQAWNHLREDGVGMMGMYGMGGVGKTTLLMQINNIFINDRCGFDFVIWIVVSKELQVGRIQDEIAQKVGLGELEWTQKNRSQKVDLLYNFLCEKRFVLLLDDIWEKVDLAEIGVPNPTVDNRCKVAFTTRSMDVCARMGVEDPMEVKCLADNDAFDLFQKKVGQRTLGSDPGIPDLARVVAQKCSGLPLALNVIGETMSCKKTIQEWRNAIKDLNSYAAEFSGMEKILRLLKYSYDSLEGKGHKGKEQIQKCLLYCALYPEDHKIQKEELIEYWICEKIIVIDGSDQGIENAEDKGYEIIGSLVRASLLMEVVNSYGEACVCMHDVVREMALWIASDLGNEKEVFVVRAGVALHEVPKVENWKVVRRISLMNNKIAHLAGSPKCLQLTTLLLQRTRLEKISSEFFKSMPKLAVLDLSNNMCISELSDGISKLVSLQYLNLSRTGIRHLPKGLRELRKLIHLDLERTIDLSSIAGISTLHKLKVLKLLDSRFRWDLNTVEELETLEHLEILTTTIHGSYGAYMERILRSHRLMVRLRNLEISNCNLESSGVSTFILEPSGISLPENMDKLRQLRIGNCCISEIKMERKCSFSSLVEVKIHDCERLRELTFLAFAPNLRKLRVGPAYELEDIINKKKACEVEASGVVPFQKLIELDLQVLLQLKNIYWSPLPFPCLEKIVVCGCPNLKKLPLDSKSCKQGENGLIINYIDQEWIEGMEWEDEATKIRFSSCLKEV